MRIDSAKTVKKSATKRMKMKVSDKIILNKYNKYANLYERAQQTHRLRDN